MDIIHHLVGVEAPPSFLSSFNRRWLNKLKCAASKKWNKKTEKLLNNNKSSRPILPRSGSKESSLIWRNWRFCRWSQDWQFPGMAVPSVDLFCMTNVISLKRVFEKKFFLFFNRFSELKRKQLFFVSPTYRDVQTMVSIILMPACSKHDTLPMLICL